MSDREDRIEALAMEHLYDGCIDAGCSRTAVSLIDARDELKEVHAARAHFAAECDRLRAELDKLRAPVEPPVLSNVQKAIDYLTGDHDLDPRQEVVGKTLEILRSAPPVLSRAAIDALIEKVGHIRGFYEDGVWFKGAEDLRDAILESLSQEASE